MLNSSSPSLEPSLCQAAEVVTHIIILTSPNTGLQVTQPAGEVVKPGAWKSVADEGMPVHGRPYEKGNLYIHFNVKFPDHLEAWQVRVCNPDQQHMANSISPCGVPQGHCGACPFSCCLPLPVHGLMQGSRWTTHPQKGEYLEGVLREAQRSEVA